MKFTEALRLADEMGLPDLRCNFIEADTSKWVGEKPPCCAIGGANVASRAFVYETEDGRLTHSSYASACGDDNEWLNRTAIVMDCGCKTQVSALARRAITHLYDYHEWSRTQIADYLDTILTE